MSRTIGILGGMGPEAGNLFYQRVIELTPAERDQDHFEVILYSLGSIPDRTAFLLGQGESPEPELVAAARRLEKWGAELIAIPCNTAHAFWESIQAAVSIPVLHIVEETAAVAATSSSDSGSREVGVLATSGTIDSRLYQDSLRRLGMVPLVPKESEQARVDQLIRRIKAGEDVEALAETASVLVGILCRQGARVVILGCTELGLLAEKLSPSCLLLDSLELLAAAAVRMASVGEVLKSATPAGTSAHSAR